MTQVNTSSQGGGGSSDCADADVDAADTTLRLAPIVDTVPVIPEAFTVRETDSDLVCSLT